MRLSITSPQQRCELYDAFGARKAMEDCVSRGGDKALGQEKDITEMRIPSLTCVCLERGHYGIRAAVSCGPENNEYCDPN